MKVALVGCGKMGAAIEGQAIRRGHDVVARLCSDGPRPPNAALLAGAEVAFEFTAPAAAEANVRHLLEAGVSVVCGTTGWTPAPELDGIARQGGVAFVVAPNFSLGVQLFYRVVRRAAEVFGAAGLHEPYVVESHHRGKRDAPSGTARRLGEIVIESDPRLREVHLGNPAGVLPPHVLQIASIRAGAEPGTHVVGFDGANDRVTLCHAARGREGFALGAVLAAEWVQGQRGRHSFEDLVDRFLAGERKQPGGPE